MSGKSLPEMFELGFKEVLDQHLSKSASVDFTEILYDKFKDKGASMVSNLALRATAERLAALKNSLASDKLSRKHKAFIEKLMSVDPVLKARDPEVVLSHYTTMVKVAPTISLDSNIVSSFLRESTSYETMSTVTIKSLLDLEKSLAETDERKKQAYGKLIGM